jgi:hypothetical protein
MSEMKLWLNPSRNNQEKKVNWAEDYEFKASVAGLEPRRRLRELYISHIQIIRLALLSTKSHERTQVELKPAQPF